jgi:acylphosphatase
MMVMHSLVCGRVQGVGFRFFVQDEARRQGVHGWVRNLPSGEVEVEVCGERDPLERLLKSLHEGPVLSRVRSVETNWFERTQVREDPGGLGTLYRF